MSVKSVYCIKWIEYERDFGSRSAGKTYYESKIEADEAYRKAFDGRTDNTPSYYLNPGEPFLTEWTADIQAYLDRQNEIENEIELNITLNSQMLLI